VSVRIETDAAEAAERLAAAFAAAAQRAHARRAAAEIKNTTTA
jgi:hypothetical protein